MENEYKVVCALSNSATFVDLEWPRTPVSRSKYGEYLANGASDPRHILVLDYGFRGRGSEWRYFRFARCRRCRA